MSWRSTGPRVITAVCAAWIIIQHYFGFGDIGETSVNILSEINLMLVMLSVGVASVSLVILQGKRVIQRAEGQWLYSILLLGSMAIWLIFGFVETTKTDYYNQWYITVPMAIELASRALIVSFMCTASYRAFRVRTWESYVTMAGFLVVAMGYSPIFEYVLPVLTPLANWVIDVPAAAGQRAIYFGTAIGAIAIAIRQILLMETRRQGGAAGGQE
jgi:hypothetical protein